MPSTPQVRPTASAAGQGRARFLGWLVALLLAGCAQTLAPLAPDTQVVQSLDRFRLEGRVSVRREEKSFSAGIRWQHDPARDEILLSSPLGQGVAELRQENGQVMLKTAEGQTSVVDGGEALLDTVLGVRLPLDGLLHWLLAQPRPGGAYQLELDGEGRVARLSQDGWRLEYGRYRLHGQRWLPGRIFARHGEQLEFRLVVDVWDVD